MSGIRSALCVCLFGCWLSPLFGQLEGRFSLPKEKFLTGEPIVLLFEVRNIGKEAVEVLRADPHTFCSGYNVRVTDGNPLTPLGPSTCAQEGEGGSCVSSSVVLRPGEQRMERYLLNSRRDMRKPGHYHVEAQRRLPYGSDGHRVQPTGGLEVTFDSAFDISVEETTGSATADDSVQPYVAQLHSEDLEKRNEAARVISTLAPASMEETLVPMLHEENMRTWGIDGLRRLNSQRARQALATFVQSAENGYERDSAIEKLGDTGDRTYLPLFVDLLRRQSGSPRGLLKAIVQLGGEEALATVVPYLSSEDAATRERAIDAVAATELRRALPLLMAALYDPEEHNRQVAAMRLVELTHRSPSATGGFWSRSDPKNDGALWQRWLMAEGGTAKLYPLQQCGPVEPLR